MKMRAKRFISESVGACRQALGSPVDPIFGESRDARAQSDPVSAGQRWSFSCSAVISLTWLKTMLVHAWVSCVVSRCLGSLQGCIG